MKNNGAFFMTSKFEKVFFCSICALILATTVYAAPWDKSQQLNKMTEAYDVNKLETVEGTVDKIFEITPPKSPNPGVHMVVKTESDSVDIHLGPAWYITNRNNILAIGDSTVAIGDLVKVFGATFEGPMNPKLKLRGMRAAEVWKKDSLVFKLRDKTGKPLWSGY